MARGLIGKAIRGATAVAVPALMEEHKAKILAGRDEALQKFQTSERVAGQEFKAEQAGFKREAATAKDVLGREQELTDATTLHERQIERIKIKAKQDAKGGKTTAKQSDVRAMVAAGVFPDNKAAWEHINNPKGSFEIALFKVMAKQQEDAAIEQGDEGFLSVQEMFEKAKTIASGKDKEPTPTPGPTGDYIEGRIYQDAQGNRAKWVNGSWEPQ
jgi:hypothetical protein